MARNPLTTKRLTFQMLPAQVRALKFTYSHTLGYTRPMTFATFVAQLVTPDGHLDRTDIRPHLESLRKPFLSGEYWVPKISGLAYGDEPLVGSERERWYADVTNEFLVYFCNASEGIRPRHEIEAPWVFNRIFRDGTHRGFIPTEHDQYGRDASKYSVGNVMHQQGTHRRERGFAFKDSPDSNALHPWLRALHMHAFSTNGQIPVSRACLLASWAERFCRQVNQVPGFNPQPYDEKWKEVDAMLKRNTDRDGRTAVISPREVMQTDTPLISPMHPVWGTIIPKFGGL